MTMDEKLTSFVPRHVGPSEEEIAEMLAEIGFSSLEEMTAAIVPAEIRLREPLELGAPLSEQAALERGREHGAQAYG